jgi:hypothetical protein
VTAFAFAVINSEAEAHRASLVPDLRDEAVSFIHCPATFEVMNIGQFCPTVKSCSDNNVRHLSFRHA